MTDTLLIYQFQMVSLEARMEVRSILLRHEVRQVETLRGNALKVAFDTAEQLVEVLSHIDSHRPPLVDSVMPIGETAHAVTMADEVRNQINKRMN
ncbi:MAG: hypothetical protein DI585_02210 [Pseudomonas fluorescens]|nr:MAG: hypothetical protein DI585_02210 [Pseudomonas fluorescens]